MNWRWIWKGSAGPGELIEEWLDERPLPAELTAAVDARWDRRLAEARADGQRLFDAPVAHLESAEGLRLRLRPARYRHWDFCAGRQAEIEAEHGPGGVCRPLALCAALSSADGQLLLQERSAKVAEGAGLLHVPGGHLEPPRHRGHGQSAAWRAMGEELREELNLEAADLDEGRLLGLGENTENGKPELLFRFHCRLSADQIRRRASGAEDAYEYRDLLFVPLAELATWRAENEKRLAVPSQALLSRLLEEA